MLDDIQMLPTGKLVPTRLPRAVARVSVILLSGFKLHRLSPGV